MSCKRLIAAGALAAALSGCGASQQIGKEDPGFGEAVKYDTALQVINPAPAYADGSVQPGSGGETGAAAVKRYRTDQVKKVETMRTTDTQGSGSSSSSAGTPR